MYYANYDANGNILGFYTDEFEYLNGIPIPNIELTLEQWQSAIGKPMTVDTVNFILVDKPPYIPTQIDLNNIIYSQLNSLDEKSFSARYQREYVIANPTQINSVALAKVQDVENKANVLRKQIIIS